MEKMKKLLKRILLVLAAAVVVVLAIAVWYIYMAVPIGTGYAAKYLCSSVFISKRNPEAVFRDDIEPVNILAKIIDTKVDYEEKSATAEALFFFKSKAIYREGCGCTLLAGVSEEEVLRRKNDMSQSMKPDMGKKDGVADPWVEDALPEGVDRVRLEKAVNAAFEEPGEGRVRRTRAVVVIYDGHLIAERYGPGYHMNMPLLGWSMSKSVTNALLGILVGRGVLRLDQPAPVPEWESDGDPRRFITIGHLMQMSSGLEFQEVYEPLYDATNMLYKSHDFGAYAARKSLETEPGGKCYYSSGTANIISRIIRHTVENDLKEDYPTFAERELFKKLGMQSAVVEFDPSGTVVGSSYTFATARDWARFGLLFLQDGIWEGERILPPGWVKYSTTAAPNSPKGQYGAHFWLNAGTASNPDDRTWPSLPKDAFSAQGYQGQRLIIIPSRKLVVVRMGLTLKKEALSIESFIFEILKSLPGEDR